MTFNDAIQRVIGGVMVKRCYQDDHDQEPWSSWIRIRLDDEEHNDEHNDESLLIIESVNLDRRTNRQLASWTEDFLSVADIRADDWEES